MQAAAGDGFIMQRPTLHRYAACSTAALTVETYRSEAGQMLARSPRHRITLNRTSHRRYAHRFGDQGRIVIVPRPRCTLGFEPAGTPLWVDGDGADYVSIFQEPALYQHVAEATRRRPDLADCSMLSPPDQLTLQVAGALAALTGTDAPAEPMLAEQLGTSLALCVLRLIEGQQGAPPPAAPKLDAGRAARVTRHIEEHLGEAALSIEELARIARMSPFHFARAFKTALGCPPHRYVVERRIERAKALIRAGRLPLAEIAQLVGFADQAHFSTVFRRETGTTPGRFRAGT
jgi:AraC family transcriptional regulator